VAAPNQTLALDCYVPILKSKQGELGALASVTDRHRLVPLIEVREGSRQAQAVASSWPDSDHVVLVQPLNFDDHDDAPWALDVTALFDSLRADGTSAVAVATTDDGPATVAALAAVVKADGRGAGIRVDAEEFVLGSSAAIRSELDQLMADLAVPPEQVDLVVDVGLVRDTVAARVATAAAALGVTPYSDRWRNLVVAFSAFPENLNEVAAKNAVTPLTREDASAYAVLISRQPARVPIYGDYAVGVPFYADVPWAPIPSIRYTEAASWLVHRGATKQNRSAQYVQLATDVVAAPYFAGSAFSPGDRYLSDVATGHDGPGNPMTYVRAATSRHLACVLDRLATLGVP